jgi:hypothetical protein
MTVKEYKNHLESLGYRVLEIWVGLSKLGALVDHGDYQTEFLECYKA